MNKIKTIITAAIALSIIPMAHSQEQKPDTIAIFNDTQRVTITTTEGGSRVVITEESNDERLVSTKQTKSKHTYTITNSESGTFINSPLGWNVSRLLTGRKKAKRKIAPHSETDGLRGIYAGGLIPIGNQGAVNGGWEIGVKNLLIGEWIAGEGLPSLSIGAGLGWKFQTIGDGYVLGSDNGVLTLRAIPAGVHDASSRIKHFHFTIPITLFIPMHKSFGISIGAELHVNTYTTASASWNRIDPTNGLTEHIKTNYKGLHQKIATAELTATLGWKEAIGLYVSWAPMGPWKKGYGPQYKTLAIGASLNF